VVEPLGYAGRELYLGQPDYCGLGVIDPNDPARVVVSTDVHPATAIPLRSRVDGRVHHELFEGRRRSAGHWVWKALTHDSVEDNIRPILVTGHGRSALLWMRGMYRSWSTYTTQVVARIA
jgi:hypothetical protein